MLSLNVPLLKYWLNVSFVTTYVDLSAVFCDFCLILVFSIDFVFSDTMSFVAVCMFLLVFWTLSDLLFSFVFCLTFVDGSCALILLSLVSILLTVVGISTCDESACTSCVFDTSDALTADSPIIKTIRANKNAIVLFIDIIFTS